MITIVIPTRNRGYTLKRVLPSYYSQNEVSQIVLVDDCSSDDSGEIIAEIAKQFPKITTTLIRNDSPLGAARCRNKGVSAAVNPYILFGEDDAYLAPGYAQILLKKLTKEKETGIVSGRLVQMQHGEEPLDALRRFGNGNPARRKIFDFFTFTHVPDAYFKGDRELPLTHALILTYKSLLEEFPFDPFYSKGNAYREESDFQVNAFVHGHKIMVTNETHCFHLHAKEVKSGGNRIHPVIASWYKIYYTHYFLKKYHGKLKTRVPVPQRKASAFLIYCAFEYTAFCYKTIRYVFRMLTSNLSKQQQPSKQE